MADGSTHYSDISAGGQSKQHNGNVYTGNTFNTFHSPEAGRRSAPPAQQAYQAPSGKKQLRKEDYTVGWICALPVPEWRASRLLLDEEHEPVSLGLMTRHQYVYGSMNEHNIVMGCLPRTQTGKGAAASVASEMVSAFPLLRFGLLVGVGGGVPSSRHDVRLGDVVVSEPDRERQHGGVVQYDYGKLIQGQGFKLNGVLNQPPEIILSGLGKVQSLPIRMGKFLEYLELYDEDDYEEFAIDGPLVDRLFPPDCVHVEKAGDCDVCASEYAEIDRKSRKAPKTRVHYGSIASGDEVLRDAIKRDEIGKEHDVLCFEMEAAGLMNVFPCLVVRGICDYSDSHKNKAWQPYAAAAAASWAKEFLRNVTPVDVGGVATIGRLVDQPQEQRPPAPTPMPPAPTPKPEMSRQRESISPKPTITDGGTSSQAFTVGVSLMKDLSSRFDNIQSSKKAALLADEERWESKWNQAPEPNARNPSVEDDDSSEEETVYKGRVGNSERSPERRYPWRVQDEPLKPSSGQQERDDDDFYARGIVERQRSPYGASGTRLQSGRDTGIWRHRSARLPQETDSDSETSIEARDRKERERREEILAIEKRDRTVREKAQIAMDQIKERDERQRRTEEELLNKMKEKEEFEKRERETRASEMRQKIEEEEEERRKASATLKESERPSSSRPSRSFQFGINQEAATERSSDRLDRNVGYTSDPATERRRRRAERSRRMSPSRGEFAGPSPSPAEHANPHDIFREFMRGGSKSQDPTTPERELPARNRHRSPPRVTFANAEDIFEQFMRSGSRGGDSTAERKPKSRARSITPPARSSLLYGETSTRPTNKTGLDERDDPPYYQTKRPPQEKVLLVSSEDLRKGRLQRLKIKHKVLERPLGPNSPAIERTEEKTISVPINQGLKVGTKLKYKELGDETERGKRDLHLIVQEKPKELPVEEGNNLVYTAMLSEEEAECGWTRKFAIYKYPYTEIVEQKGRTDWVSKVLHGRGLPLGPVEEGVYGTLVVRVHVIPNSVMLRDYDGPE